MDTILKVNHISKSFDGRPVLDDVSFSLNENEKLSITGPGGCGKTTLLKIILGLIEPDEGSIELFGINMQEASYEVRLATQKKIGMAFQQGALFDFMTVEDNLTFAMEHMTDMPSTERDEQIKMLLSAIKLSRTLKMFPYELSGGMQRRIGIARCLTTNPQLAIFDEPTSGLDPVTSTIILNMIHDLTKEKAHNSQLIATTNVEVTLRFSSRIIVLNQGKTVADGPWKKLLVEADPWVQHFLSVRLIGLDREYALGLHLPETFMKEHW